MSDYWTYATDARTNPYTTGDCFRPCVNIKIKKMHPDARMPTYAEHGAAGIDLYCLEDITIYPGETAVIDTGIAFEVPANFYIQLEEKSGISIKTPLYLKAGIIDPTYRDSVKVVLHYDGHAPEGEHKLDKERGVAFAKGQKIAQGTIHHNLKAVFAEVDELSETTRGTGGFGSTGLF